MVEKNRYLTILFFSQLYTHLHTCQKSHPFACLEQVSLTENVTDAVSITWAVHHDTQKRVKQFEVSISSLLPFIIDQAHSVATIKHAIEKFRDTVAFLNPAQINLCMRSQGKFSGNGLTMERTDSLSYSEDSI